MDWEPHPVARPPLMFPKSNNNGGTAMPPAAHSRAFLSSASSTSPFLFNTSEMQLDEPPKAEHVPIASTSAASSSTLDDQVASENNKVLTDAQTRDIANGAVQRERRKRDQLKNWQVAKGKGVQVEDEDDEKDDGDDTVDEVETSFMESLSLSAPIKSLLRRTRSSRRRGEHAPVHLSLHNHNYHWPHNGQEPFQFGALSTPPSNSGDLSSPQRLSGWWHSDMPYVLLGYLQFGFNTSLILVSLYLLLSFLMLLKHDVSERVSEYSIEIQQEIMHCSSQYISNRCQPGERVPAMETMCKQWDFCMNKDPKVVNKLRVAAEIVAEVVNGFVEVISWRTMLFLLGTLFIIVAYTNRTITTYRQHHSDGNSTNSYTQYGDQHRIAPHALSGSAKLTMQ